MQEEFVTQDKYEELMKKLAIVQAEETIESRKKAVRRAKNKIARKQRKVNKR